MRSAARVTAARLGLVQAAVVFESNQTSAATKRDLRSAASELVAAEAERAEYLAWRKKNPSACPCQGPEDDPGPTHIAACPFSDPDYEPPMVVVPDPEFIG